MYMHPNSILQYECKRERYIWKSDQNLYKLPPWIQWLVREGGRSFKPIQHLTIFKPHRTVSHLKWERFEIGRPIAINSRKGSRETFQGKLSLRNICIWGYRVKYDIILFDRTPISVSHFIIILRCYNWSKA